MTLSLKTSLGRSPLYAHSLLAISSSNSQLWAIQGVSRILILLCAIVQSDMMLRLKKWSCVDLRDQRPRLITRRDLHPLAQCSLVIWSQDLGLLVLISIAYSSYPMSMDRTFHYYLALRRSLDPIPQIIVDFLNEAICCMADGLSIIIHH